MSQDMKQLIRGISKFNEDSMLTINLMTAEIESMLVLNEEKSKMYSDIRRQTPQSTQHLVLANDIFSDTFKVVNLKMKLTQFYLQDMYKRIEILGKAVETLIGSSDKPSTKSTLTRLRSSDVDEVVSSKSCRSGSCSGSCAR